MSRTHKTSIGIEHLNSAMLLYTRGNAFHSALHLAGAAEEIIGKVVDHILGTPKDSIKEGEAMRCDLAARQEMEAIFNGRSVNIEDLRNRSVASKNYVKHYDRPDEKILLFNPKIEARNTLLRTISNLNMLLDEPGDEIDRFEDRLRVEEFEEIEAELPATLRLQG